MKFVLSLIMFVSHLAYTLPASSQNILNVPDKITSVSIQDRALVIVVSDLSDGFENMTAEMYQFIEAQALTRATNTLTQHYGKTSIVQGPGATAEQFVNVLRDATNQAKAVDVVFVTHGLVDSIQFSTGNTISGSALSIKIRETLTPTQRTRLRAVFSTACYGRSHINDWLNAGFQVVSGGNLIYADSAASYQPFLDAWAGGARFSSAIKTANGSDPLRIWDQAARVFYASHPNNEFRKFAGQVDSFRRVGGNGNTRIDKMVKANFVGKDLVALTGLIPQQANLAPSETILAGGTGGSQAVLDCAADEALIGIYGRAGQLIDKVGPICSRTSGTQWTGETKRKGSAGGNGGNSFDRQCATNWVVYGIEVKSGMAVDAIRVHCRPLGNSNSNQSLSLVPIGGPGGVSTRNLNCESSTNGMGLNVSAGNIVDRIGLRCL